LVVALAAALVVAGCATAPVAAPPPATTPTSAAGAPSSPSGTSPLRAADLIGKVTAAARGKRTYHVTAVPIDNTLTYAAEGSVRIGSVDTDHVDIDTAADLDIVVQVKPNDGNPPQALRFVTLDAKTYVKVTPAYQPPPGKPWVALDRQAQDDFTNSMFGFNDVGVQETVPTAYALPMLAAGGEITGSAPEGDATRYKITLDLRKAMDSLTNPYLKDEAKYALDAGGRSMDFELVVDRQYTMLRLKSSAKAVSTGQPVVYDVRFDKWGDPVDLATPPPAETTTR
jgi:hypothetical protein